VNLHKFEDLATMEAMINDLSYEVDGIVLKVNNLEDQEQLGHSGDDPTGDPRGALAWKFAEESKIAVVKEIEWNTGRTGRVTPKAIFEQGIQLAGTTVSQATCNNYGWASRMKIGVGTHVKVIKAGKIIPKVIEVVKNPVNTLIYPYHCPVCLENLEVVTGNDDNQELVCNNLNCAARNVKTYLFYLTSLGAKGIGESALERIIASGKAKFLDEIYNLTIDDLISTGEFTERQATLAIATIHMVKPVADNDKLKAAIEKARNKPKTFQAWQFFGALGISGAGKTAGKALVDHFGDFDKVRKANIDELVVVDGIGAKTAEYIQHWFEINSDMLDRLLTHVELEYPTVGKLSGKTFVLTGSFDLGKSYWEQKIDELGGKISNSVGSKTDYVVAGPKAGSKLDKAKEKGIPVIDVQELETMLS
jgi:DNA ligase (NAD+)